mgnify:CR=1 FL=1
MNFIKKIISFFFPKKELKEKALFKDRCEESMFKPMEKELDKEISECKNPNQEQVSQEQIIEDIVSNGRFILTDDGGGKYLATSVIDLADLLDVSVSTVYRLMKKKDNKNIFTYKGIEVFVNDEIA